MYQFPYSVVPLLHEVLHGLEEWVGGRTKGVTTLLLYGFVFNAAAVRSAAIIDFGAVISMYIDRPCPEVPMRHIRTEPGLIKLRPTHS